MSKERKKIVEIEIWECSESTTKQKKLFHTLTPIKISRLVEFESILGELLHIYFHDLEQKTIEDLRSGSV